MMPTANKYFHKFTMKIEAYSKVEYDAVPLYWFIDAVIAVPIWVIAAYRINQKKPNRNKPKKMTPITYMA